MDFTEELSRKGALQRAEWVVTIVDVWFTWVVRSLLVKRCHAMERQGEFDWPGKIVVYFWMCLA
jgi:hypothetical protein